MKEVLITKQTVFILGSGASKPYGFPIDAQLRERIRKDFGGDFIKLPYTIDLSPNSLKFEKVKRRDFVDKFTESLSTTYGIATIDEFLEINHREYEFIGKIAIQHYLLEYEREFLSKNKIEPVNDWFEIVLNELLEEAKKEKNPSSLIYLVEDITFLTFSYDRILEYLYLSKLMSLFPQHSGFMISNNIFNFFWHRIKHLYGSIGNLPWEIELDNFNEVQFGESIESYDRITKTINNIRLIKDGLKSTQEIGKKIKNAKRIFFLGNGYIEKNMKALNLEDNLNFDDPPEIYGTAFGLENKINKIKEDYFSFSEEIPTLKIEPLKCKELIAKYL